MEFVFKTDELDDNYKNFCARTLFPCLNKLTENIDSLKYFVIGSMDTDIFIETIAEYSALLHINSHSENSEQYHVAAKTIEGRDESGELCQAILVQSGLVVGFFSDLVSLSGREIENASYENMKWLGLTTIIHELGHAIDNEAIYKIRNEINTRSTFNLRDPNDREQYILLSCISIWGEYFAESFVFDCFDVLRNEPDGHLPRLMECCDSYIGEDIPSTDRVYRIIYFFVHLLAQKGASCYDIFLDEGSPLYPYRNHLINIGNEILVLKEKYPNWNMNEDLEVIKGLYQDMLSYEQSRRAGG